MPVLQPVHAWVDEGTFLSQVPCTLMCEVARQLFFPCQEKTPYFSEPAQRLVRSRHLCLLHKHAHTDSVLSVCVLLSGAPFIKWMGHFCLVTGPLEGASSK